MSTPLSFVRQEMLPAMLPPVRDAGLVGWLRANLFSTPWNGLMTVVSAAIVVSLLMQIFPWLSRSVWGAQSLAECRAIIVVNYGEGSTGACWAVIRARWPQYIFGFYPSGLYWRPVLAFILMFVALAPILFAHFPRKMMWFSASYPAVAFWLIWGGSVWVPAVAMLALVVGYVAARALAFLDSPILSGTSAVIAALFWWIFCAGFVADILTQNVPISLQVVPSRELGGFLLALIVGVTGIAFSLPLGIFLALGRQSDMFLINKLSVGFIEFVRGVPLITLLYTASQLLNYFLPPGTEFDLVLRVIIMVTFFAAAYIAEVIRGGLAALPKGQYEAADALGLNYWQATRLIIMPQALKISIPGIVSTFIGLFKDTTLVVFVNLYEPLKGITDVIRNDSAWKGIYWEPYIFVGAIFFILCFSMSRYSIYLERKLKTDHR